MTSASDRLRNCPEEDFGIEDEASGWVSNGSERSPKVISPTDNFFLGEGLGAFLGEFEVVGSAVSRGKETGDFNG